MDWYAEVQKKIKRPLFIFDLETTGNDPAKDEIVQFYGIVIPPKGYFRVSLEFQCKPSIPISTEAYSIHKISNESLNGVPSFDNYAKVIVQMLPPEFDVVGYNICKFDLPILDRQLSACGYSDVFAKCHIFDSFTCFRQQFPRTLEAAVGQYLGIPISNSHDAKGDVQSVCLVLARQLMMEPDSSFLEIADRTSKPPNKRIGFTDHLLYNENNEIVFGFGKHKGEPVIDHADYVQWVLQQDFPEAVKKRLKLLFKENS